MVYWTKLSIMSDTNIFRIDKAFFGSERFIFMPGVAVKRNRLFCFCWHDFHTSCRPRARFLTVNFEVLPAPRVRCFFLATGGGEVLRCFLRVIEFRYRSTSLFFSTNCWRTALVHRITIISFILANIWIGKVFSF